MPSITQEGISMLEGLIHILKGLCLWEKKVLHTGMDKNSKAIMIDFIEDALESIQFIEENVIANKEKLVDVDLLEGSLNDETTSSK